MSSPYHEGSEFDAEEERQAEAAKALAEVNATGEEEQEDEYEEIARTAAEMNLNPSEDESVLKPESPEYVAQKRRSSLDEERDRRIKEIKNFCRDKSRINMQKLRIINDYVIFLGSELSQKKYN